MVQRRSAIVAEFGSGVTLGFTGGTDHLAPGKLRPGVSHHHRTAAGDDALLNHPEDFLRKLFLLLSAHARRDSQRPCDKPAQSPGSNLI